MLIQGAFMHVHESLTAGQFLKYLADEAPGGHFYIAQPPPGIIMTAAIDWRVIVPDSAALEAVVTALWSGYESLVKPLQTDSHDATPLIFIQIKNHRGESDQFTLGKDVDKKDGFVHRVKESVAILSSKNKGAVKLEIEKTTGSDYWQQVC